MFREHYREADWTPRDDTVNRFREHYWGLFGLAIVFAFVVMAVWAPVLGPVTAQENIYSPYENEIQYVEDGEVKTATHGPTFCEPPCERLSMLAVPWVAVLTSPSSTY